LLVDIAKLPSYRVERVIDGDSLVLTSVFQRIEKTRLMGVDSPELKQDWGNEAKQFLSDLIEGELVYVEDHGKDSFKRQLVTLYLRDIKRGVFINVNELLILLGHAWVATHHKKTLNQRRADNLLAKWKWAKQRKLGMWSLSGHQAPWEYRAAKRDKALKVNSINLTEVK